MYTGCLIHHRSCQYEESDCTKTPAGMFRNEVAEICLSISFTTTLVFTNGFYSSCPVTLSLTTVEITAGYLQKPTENIGYPAKTK